MMNTKVYRLCLKLWIRYRSNSAPRYRVIQSINQTEYIAEIQKINRCKWNKMEPHCMQNKLLSHHLSLSSESTLDVKTIFDAHLLMICWSIINSPNPSLRLSLHHFNWIDQSLCVLKNGQFRTTLYAMEWISKHCLFGLWRIEEWPRVDRCHLGVQRRRTIEST